MTDRDKALNEGASRAFIEHLESQGFFQQIKDLETSLGTIAGELSKFGTAAAQRLEETENLAAHVLALQSVVTVLARQVPLVADDVVAEVKARTAELSGDPEGSRTVQAIAADILAKSRA